MNAFRKILISIVVVVSSVIGLLFALEAYGAEEFRYKCDGKFVDHQTEEDSATTAYFILRKYGLPNRISSKLYGTLTLDIPSGGGSIYRIYYVDGAPDDDLLFITDVGETTNVRGKWSWVSRGILMRLTDHSFFEGICTKNGAPS